MLDAGLTSGSLAIVMKEVLVGLVQERHLRRAFGVTIRVIMAGLLQIRGAERLLIHPERDSEQLRISDGPGIYFFFGFLKKRETHTSLVSRF